MQARRKKSMFFTCAPLYGAGAGSVSTSVCKRLSVCDNLSACPSLRSGINPIPCLDRGSLFNFP